MEIDGKTYYQRVSWGSANRLGKRLFQHLAVEEDIHRQKFEQIHAAIGKEKAWPEVDFQADRGKKLKTIFGRATEEMCLNVNAPATELDAIQTAMNMENKSYDFYEGQIQHAIYNAEIDYYQILSAEERGHYLVLLDYYEYLKDPAGWFVGKERPSLDGG